MKGLRRLARRGQATVELALAAPLVFGLLALTLQGGIVLSDQVNLEHYAYEAAQWQLANPDATRPQLVAHITAQMCGATGSIGSPLAGASRYCRQSPAGVNNLVIEVNPPGFGARSTPTSMAPVPSPGPTGQVLAATTCKAWHLDVSFDPNSPVYTASIGANQVATLTITLRVTGTGLSDADPQVKLSAAGYPLGLASGSPLINPPTLYTNGMTSKMDIREGATVIPGDYKITVTGQDQCGQGPSVASTVMKLTVGPATPTFPPVALPPLVAVDPVKVGVCAGTPTTVHLRGRGFQAGATVKFGSTLGAGTTVTGFGASSQMDSTTTLPAGVYDILVTNLDGSKGVAAGGLTVLAAGACPTADPTAPVHPCSGNVAGAYQNVIHIRWWEPLALPLLTTGAPPTVQLDVTQTVLCQQ